MIYSSTSKKFSRIFIPHSKGIKMKLKKFAIGAVCAATALGAALSMTACGKDSNTIYVDTNAYFAPFEYYGGDSGLEIVGVDVEIMNKVGEKLGKKVVYENTDFDVIIDNVASGNKYDCGAAGITVTEERKQKVDFSIPYFTSVQYVIMPATATVTAYKDGSTDYVLWSTLAGKKIGYQRDTTGDIYVNLEISGEEDYTGQLQGTNAQGKAYDNAQLAVDAISANQVDVVVVDKLPAQYIVSKNSNYKCYALYYPASADNTAAADFPTEEQYAICVTKGNTELLSAINEVLTELGENGINALVSKHLGLTND